MNTITDRYLAAVGNHLPPAISGDVQDELRAAIADMADGEFGHLPPAEAEVRALESLGDPRKLAREYAPHLRYLIGPELYGDYTMLLKVLLWAVVPAVTVVFGVNLALLEPGAETATVAEIIFGAVGGGINVAIHLVFWVSVVFVFLQSQGLTASGAKVAPAARDRAWSVADLPRPAPARQVGVGEMITNVSFGVIVLAIIVLQQFRSPFTAAQGPVPFINPALWGSWLPVIMALLLLSIVTDVLIFRRGRYTLPLSLLSTAGTLLFAAIAGTLFATGQFVNQAWLDILLSRTGDSLDPRWFSSTLGMLLVVAIAGYEIVETWYRYAKARRTADPTGRDT